VEIWSHTDSRGEDDYNLNLSQERAQSVVDYLISRGIEASRLDAKGYGESKPIAANKLEDGSDNPSGRSMNRRTEFKIVGNISRF
ncbi:MAG: OmpA family protein, partial [Bacteroidota bacterium]